MKREDVETIRALVHARSGVVLDPEKTYQIETGLAPVARRAGFASLADLVQAIRAQRDERLLWAATEALTSSETSFFRDRVPFRAFREEILPELIAKRGDKPIRIWCAAGGTGQEPYSLAMIIDDELAKLGEARIELFASDISERALEKAQRGLYTQFEVQRGLPIRLLVRHFEKVDDQWALSPRIRQMVRWRRINLLADLRPLGRFDVILCRNVLSSFDEPTRRRVLDQLANALAEDGWLVLGVDETVSGATDRLKPVPGRRGFYAPSQEAHAAA
ncbi:MAG TPA: protein-glutamate O-methyltransferase CheR [Caulobacteraceae bacterium]|jgi:chemotaxis protein methyltransferase CheR|nr:protein-glutamate O-methyltransferase CheR [Caulobacteraceae bacterium]